MSTAENRRKAYAIVADLVFQLVAGTGPSDSLPVEVRRELQRIYEAMAAAALVVDGPGVEEHASGDGKPPKVDVGMYCPVYGTNGCRHEYPGNNRREPGARYCVGAVCVAYDHGERPTTRTDTPFKGLEPGEEA